MPITAAASVEERQLTFAPLCSTVFIPEVPADQDFKINAEFEALRAPGGPLREVGPAFRTYYRSTTLRGVESAYVEFLAAGQETYYEDLPGEPISVAHLHRVLRNVDIKVPHILMNGKKLVCLAHGFGAYAFHEVTYDLLGGHKVNIIHSPDVYPAGTVVLGKFPPRGQ